MSAFSPLEATISSSTTIGRYFAAISMVPAVLLVLYVTILTWAGAWSGPVDPSGVSSGFAAFGWQDAAWFAAAALVVALAIHPLQFALTQLLEGYWGTTRLALAFAERMVSRHHRKVVWLENRGAESAKRWIVRGSEIWDPTMPHVDWRTVGQQELENRERPARRALAIPSGAELLPPYLAQQAYAKKRAMYPDQLQRILPTRLGNVLRKSEDSAGKQYGLDTLIVAPHLSLVAQPEHNAYVRDRQKAMDLAIAMCLVSSIATAISAVLLSDDGAWCLVSLAPAGVSYASYRGAVATARSYNVAIETVTDLSRFALYDALRVAQPNNGREERETAATLMALLKGMAQPDLQLVQPKAASDGTASSDLAAQETPADG